MYSKVFQINFSPGDIKLVTGGLLHHQLKTWLSQVDKVYLVCDTKKSKGRFGKGWENNFQQIKKIKVEVLYVDYTELKLVGEIFFNNKMPQKDFRGGPFYSYFYALHKIDSKFILHTDSDIFLVDNQKVGLKKRLIFE